MSTPTGVAQRGTSWEKSRPDSSMIRSKVIAIFILYLCCPFPLFYFFWKSDTFATERALKRLILLLLSTFDCNKVIVVLKKNE